MTESNVAPKRWYEQRFHHCTKTVRDCKNCTEIYECMDCKEMK